MSNSKQIDNSSAIKYIPFVLGFMGMEYFLITSFPGWKGLGWALAYAGSVIVLIGLVLGYNKLKAAALEKVERDIRLKVESVATVQTREKVERIKSYAGEFKEINNGVNK